MRDTGKALPSLRIGIVAIEAAKVSATLLLSFLNVQRTVCVQPIEMNAVSVTQKSIAIASSVFENISVHDFSMIQAPFLKRTTNR